MKANQKKSSPRRARSYRQKLKQEMREQILRSAEYCFAEKGFADAKIEDIAGHAGIAVGTIYLHFGSKEDLYFTLLNETIDHFDATIREAVVPPMTSIERVQRITEAELELIERKKPAFKIFLQETQGFDMKIEARLGSRIMTRYRRHIKFLSEIFDRGIADGEFNERLDPLDMAVALQGMINAFVTHWTDRGAPGDYRANAAVILNIFFGNTLQSLHSWEGGSLGMGQKERVRRT